MKGLRLTLAENVHQLEGCLIAFPSLARHGIRLLPYHDIMETKTKHILEVEHLTHRSASIVAVYGLVIDVPNKHASRLQHPI
jgi:hypothetical protein